MGWFTKKGRAEFDAGVDQLESTLIDMVDLTNGAIENNLLRYPYGDIDLSSESDRLALIQSFKMAVEQLPPPEQWNNESITNLEVSLKLAHGKLNVQFDFAALMIVSSMSTLNLACKMASTYPRHAKLQHLAKAGYTQVFDFLAKIWEEGEAYCMLQAFPGTKKFSDKLFDVEEGN